MSAQDPRPVVVVVAAASAAARLSALCATLGAVTVCGDVSEALGLRAAAFVVDIGLPGAAEALSTLHPALAVGDDRAAVLACLGQAADVAPAPWADDELRARVAALIADVDRRRQTLRLVAHDLNNPLASIRLLGEMVEGDVPAEFTRDLHDIVAASDAATALAESLGALVRLRPDTRPAFAAVDLRQVTERATSRPVFRGRVGTRTPEHAVIVHGAADVLAQALTDLLLNACRLAGESPVDLVVAQDGRLTVSGPGPSLSTGARAQLRVPWNAAGLREQRLPVAALGLAYAAWAAGAHGGRLDLDDRPDGGLCATLVLPLRVASH